MLTNVHAKRYYTADEWLSAQRSKTTKLYAYMVRQHVQQLLCAQMISVKNIIAREKRRANILEKGELPRQFTSIIPQRTLPITHRKPKFAKCPQCGQKIWQHVHAPITQIAQTTQKTQKFKSILIPTDDLGYYLSQQLLFAHTYRVWAESFYRMRKVYRQTNHNQLLPIRVVEHITKQKQIRESKW